MNFWWHWAIRGGSAPWCRRPRSLTARINAELEVGRDRLLELHSHQPAQAAELVETLRSSTGGHVHCATSWWPTGMPSGLNMSRDRAVDRAAARSHMLNEHIPGLGGEPVTVTFTRADALAHEDRQFLTWEHPMVRGCMEMLTSGELGAAAVTVCSHPDYRTGTVFLEALFVTECAAPRGLEMQRYLPPTCLRFLLDAQGEDKSEVLAHEQLTRSVSVTEPQAGRYGDQVPGCDASRCFWHMPRNWRRRQGAALADRRCSR